MRNNQAKIGTVGRILRTVRQFYPVLLPVTVACILFNAVVSSIPSIFMQNVIALVEQNWQNGDWSVVGPQILSLVALLATFYGLSLAASLAFNQLMAIITQGTLKKLRQKLFGGMQRLPIKYFDQNDHGDIMSHYTNDIDTLRQMISQSFPQLLASSVMVLTVFCIMIYYCLWLTLVILVGVVAMLIVTKKVGGQSAKYFFRQQAALGKLEGFVEEMMNGQKVIKVFCHEEETKAAFDSVNDALFAEAERANRYANILMPILNNIGNVLYVLVALTGGLLLLTGAPNVSLSGMAMSISIAVPFLNMTRQFVGNISQVSNQVNSVVMGLAGAERIFELMDQEPEQDEGYVTLVNATEKNGQLVECKERTGTWAWKHPHKADGTVTYTKLQGDVTFNDVDFGYDENKIVLHNIKLYATPGQKIAFVGSTGAGKTTITNLINRFYDIADGKIRYDGININKIKKADLRRSLGMVLQDTHLFTGTVMENIRYGRLDATDEEVMAAARAVSADQVAMKLEKGYASDVGEGGDRLSTGEKQLISFARAVLADPRIFVLDEATSSIDTKTERLIQEATEFLLKGRTSFLIAHRLSTIRRADLILVVRDGAIVEQGTHDQLIRQKGYYRDLYRRQFEQEKLQRM